MRKSKKPVAAPKMSPQLSPYEEDLLRPGDVVMLPDGAVAAVDRIVGTDAYVIEWYKQLGRGPWIYPMADLVLVS